MAKKKTELIALLQKSLAQTNIKAKFSQKEATAVFDAVIGVMKTEVAATGSFSYPQFGKFHTVQSKPYKRNLDHLRDGLGVVETPERTRVKFKISKPWFEELNAGDKPLGKE